MSEKAKAINKNADAALDQVRGKISAARKKIVTDLDKLHGELLQIETKLENEADTGERVEECSDKRSFYIKIAKIEHERDEIKKTQRMVEMLLSDVGKIQLKRTITDPISNTHYGAGQEVPPLPRPEIFCSHENGP